MYHHPVASGIFPRLLDKVFISFFSVFSCSWDKGNTLSPNPKPPLKHLICKSPETNLFSSSFDSSSCGEVFAVSGVRQKSPHRPYLRLPSPIPTLIPEYLCPEHDIWTLPGENRPLAFIQKGAPIEACFYAIFTCARPYPVQRESTAFFFFSRPSQR